MMNDNITDRTDEERRAFVWALYREDCPAPYRPIIDAAMTLPLEVRHVPNCFRTIRLTVPDASDNMIRAAFHWKNRLNYADIEDIPAVADERLWDVRVSAKFFAYTLASMPESHRPVGEMAMRILTEAIKRNVYDVSDDEVLAAFHWEREMHWLTPQELSAVYGAEYANMMLMMDTLILEKMSKP
jgi:hypothetical protein